MKNKILLKTLTVAMTAVCLASCTQTPATEIVTETETEVETTTTTTEASADETESSTTESEEVKNEVIFSSEMIVNAANKYGMTETENYSEWVQMITDDSTTYHSVYYVMDDSEEANKWYYASYLVAENSNFPDIQVNECILGFEKISEGADGRNAFTEIYMFTAADDQSALDLYNALCIASSDYEVVSGEKDGYTYSVRYMGNGKRQMTAGVYLQNNTVIFINNGGEVEEDGGCIGFFCNELGLESPLTLK